MLIGSRICIIRLSLHGAGQRYSGTVIFGGYDVSLTVPLSAVPLLKFPEKSGPLVRAQKLSS